MHKSRILSILAVAKENAEENLDASLSAAPAPTDTPAPPTDAPVVPDELPAIAEPEVADEEAVAVADADQELGETIGAAEQVEEQATALENLIDILKGHAEDGLTPAAAQLAQFSAESIFNNIGLDIADAGLPSMESFSTHSNRAKATTLSVEALGDKLKQIWAAVVEFLKKIKDQIIAMFQRFFNAQAAIEARAQKLIDAVKAARDAGKTSAKNSQIELGALAGKLAIGTKVDISVQTVSNLQAVVDETLVFDAEGAKRLLDSAQNIREAAAAGTTIAHDKFALVNAIQLPNMAAFKHKVDGPGVKQKTDVLPGNVSFYVGTESTKLGELTCNLYVSGKIKEAGKVEGSHKASVLSLDDCQKIAEEVRSLVGVSTKEAGAKAKERIEASKKAFADVKIGSEANIKDKVFLQSMMRAFQKGEAEQGKAIARVVGYAIETGNAYLTFVQKCLAQYGAEAKGVVEKAKANGGKAIGQDKGEPEGDKKD